MFICGALSFGFVCAEIVQKLISQSPRTAMRITAIRFSVSMLSSQACFNEAPFPYCLLLIYLSKCELTGGLL